MNQKIVISLLAIFAWLSGYTMARAGVLSAIVQSWVNKK